jgi:CheY-like chemotaxis protein
MFGCSFEAVENGAEAVEAVRGGAFDLVLMDIKMPVMDGVQATRAIRALGDGKGSIPVLALTANADDHDARDYLVAGMDAVVSKPIQPDVLLDAIRRAMGSPLRDAA